MSALFKRWLSSDQEAAASDWPEARRWAEKAVHQIETEQAREDSGETEDRQTWEDRAEREILRLEMETLAGIRP